MHFEKEHQDESRGVETETLGNRGRGRTGARGDGQIGKLQSDLGLDTDKVTVTTAFHAEDRREIRRHASNRRQPGIFVQTAGEIEADDP